MKKSFFVAILIVIILLVFAAGYILIGNIPHLNYDNKNIDNVDNESRELEESLDKINLIDYENLNLNELLVYLNWCKENIDNPENSIDINRNYDDYCYEGGIYSFPSREGLKELELLNNLPVKLLCDSDFNEQPYITCEETKKEIEECERIWSLSYSSLGVRPHYNIHSIVECDSKHYYQKDFGGNGPLDTSIYEINIDNNIIDQLKKDFVCFSGSDCELLAEKESDPSICDNSEYQDNINRCYANWVSHIKNAKYLHVVPDIDIGVCDLINNESYKWSCYDKIAFLNTDDSVCDLIPYEFNEIKEVCNIRTAKNSSCTNLNTTTNQQKSQKSDCQFSLAIRQDDMSICSEIEYIPDNCYKYFAKKEFDYSICENYIISDLNKRLCKEAVALENDDNEYCESIDDVEYRDSCYSSFAYYKDESGWCLKISSSTSSESCLLRIESSLR